MPDKKIERHRKIINEMPQPLPPSPYGNAEIRYGSVIRGDIVEKEDVPLGVQDDEGEDVLITE